MYKKKKFILKRKINSGGGSKIPDFLASHDSATGLVMALSDFLKGKAFKGVGAVPANELYATIINSLPVPWRRKLYSWTGKISATPGKKTGQIDASNIDKWIYDIYPEKKYPAIAIGSCNGAMVHLCAAMGIPWLPQTLLITVDKGKNFPVDEPKQTIDWARDPADNFLKANPGWQLHHMMDPNQDRLRVKNIAYFRIKKLELGEWYQKFIEERLAPGGQLIIVDCDFKWPVKKMGDRHYFQFGGAGGLKPEEYYQGSPAVKEFLKNSGTNLEKWDAPVPDTEAPEAEWGLEKSLVSDISKFADRKNIKKEKVTFDHPQDLSAAVAKIYCSWYSRNGKSTNRLLADNFNMISPYLSIKKNCIPYWLFFNVDNAAADLENFLSNSEGIDEIYMMILSHGKNSKGSTPILRWESIMKRANKRNAFVGTTPQEYPVDLAVYARYSKDLEKIVPEDHAFPEPLEPLEALQLLEVYRAHTSNNVF